MLGGQKTSLLRMLNQLAKSELEASREGTGPGSDGLLTDEPIANLTIKPEAGHAESNVIRWFSVYIPESLTRLGNMVKVETIETQGDIELNKNTVELHRHRQRPELLIGQFGIHGKQLGENTWIKCSMDDQEDVAYFEVAPPSPKRPVGPPRPPKGGFFKNIKPNNESDPFFRTSFQDGTIYYFSQFPAVKDLVEGDRINTTEGKVMVAELIAEAVCSALARHRIEEGLVPSRPDEDPLAALGRYEAEVNRLRKKCLAEIHHWTMRQNFLPPAVNAAI